MIKIIKLFEFGENLHFRNIVLGTKQSSTLSGKSTDTIDWQVNRKRKLVYYGKKTCIESNHDVHLSVKVLKQKIAILALHSCPYIIALIVKIRG